MGARGWQMGFAKDPAIGQKVLKQLRRDIRDVCHKLQRLQALGFHLPKIFTFGKLWQHRPQFPDATTYNAQTSHKVSRGVPITQVILSVLGFTVTVQKKLTKNVDMLASMASTAWIKVPHWRFLHDAVVKMAEGLAEVTRKMRAK